MTFEQRSALPVAAACVVASGARETLAAMLGMAVTMRLFEPTLPSECAWSAIARDAHLYRVRGDVADAAIVLRPSDALALAGAAFGECVRERRALSPIERDALSRTVAALAAHLAPVCGLRESMAVEPLARLVGHTTYFELHATAPIECRIGVALSRDPTPEAHGCLTIDDILDVDIELSARLELGTLSAGDLANLEEGSILPTQRFPNGGEGSLRLAGWPMTRGECGVNGNRYALTIRERVAIQGEEP
jgi:flagellar motor switch/type III secretory pathway protein FliN